MEARLTRDERAKVADLIQQRVTTRKPAAYLVNTAWIRGRPFYVDERVIVPRSYIGELLDESLSAVVPDPDSVESVLDLCTGSGCLAILAALTFPNAAVDAVDISVGALEVSSPQRRGLRPSRPRSHPSLRSLRGPRRSNVRPDHLQPALRDGRSRRRLPARIQGEPELAHLGGDDGLDLVRRILAEAAVHLEY